MNSITYELRNEAGERVIETIDLPESVTQLAGLMRLHNARDARLVSVHLPPRITAKNPWRALPLLMIPPEPPTRFARLRAWAGRNVGTLVYLAIYAVVFLWSVLK